MRNAETLIVSKKYLIFFLDIWCGTYYHEAELDSDQLFNVTSHQVEMGRRGEVRDARLLSNVEMGRWRIGDGQKGGRWRWVGGGMPDCYPMCF